MLAKIDVETLWRYWNMVPPLGQILIGGVVAIAALFLVYALLKLVAPKVTAIARTTAKEGWSHPLFWVLVSVGIIGLYLFVFFPYNTFGEDVKMYKQSGLTVITLLSIFLAVYTASITIADELEGRTALTVMSKPIGRRQFVFGKFLGVLAPAYTIFVVLGVFFLTMVLYKVGYDSRETSNPYPGVNQQRAEVMLAVPGLVLSFFEMAVMSSIAIAISTRWPMLPNLMTCFSVWVLGHLGPLLVQSSVGQIPLVRFMGQLLAIVLPGLEYYSSETAITAEKVIPLAYLGATGIYSAIYITIAMLAALLMFEDRDLA
jgi:ABC-type transport system involved in multi-copper enzyme maturation permease subunit